MVLDLLGRSGMSGTAEFLTTELKQLIGWGAHPKRLALLPTLRGLAGVEEEPSMVTAGYIVRRYLETAISKLDGHHTFMGRSYEAHDMKRWFRLLLQFEGIALSAENRRYRVITGLGVFYSVEAWRRPFGPERNLLAILAESMIPANLATD
jgi:hypothetical protein